MLVLFQAFCVNQVLFVVGHVLAHARIIEHQDKFLLGFHHHYKSSRSLADHWLWNRLALFFPVHQTSFTDVHSVIIFVALTLIAFMGFNSRAFVCVSVIFFWQHVAAVSHELYHLPIAERPKHFTFPVRFFLETLEFLNVLDASRHKGHHQHTFDTLFEARDFFQLRVPDFINDWGNAYWRWLVRAYTPGDDRMTQRSVKIMAATTLILTVGYAWLSSLYIR